jgi:hypothetical protein
MTRINSRAFHAALAVTTLATCPYLWAQTRYQVSTLPGLGGTASQANSINQRSWVSGAANLEGDTISKAALWIGDSLISLGALGGANANSAVAWPVKNDAGVIVGISDTDQDNPLGEAFSCWPFFASGAPTGKICNGFRWRDGALTPLPAFPGGYDSYATAANNRGEIVGWAENGVHDSTCVPTSQVLQFRAVIWEPWGEMKELPPLPNTGDTPCSGRMVFPLTWGVSAALPGTRRPPLTTKGLWWDSRTFPATPTERRITKRFSGPDQRVCRSCPC